VRYPQIEEFDEQVVVSPALSRDTLPLARAARKVSTGGWAPPFWTQKPRLRGASAQDALRSGQASGTKGKSKTSRPFDFAPLGEARGGQAKLDGGAPNGWRTQKTSVQDDERRRNSKTAGETPALHGEQC